LTPARFIVGIKTARPPSKFLGRSVTLYEYTGPVSVRGQPGKPNEVSPG